MAGMALYPDEIHPVGGLCFQKTLPQVNIFHRTALTALPVIFHPVVDPVLVEGIGQVFGIRVQIYLAGAV